MSEEQEPGNQPDGFDAAGLESLSGHAAELMSTPPAGAAAVAAPAESTADGLREVLLMVRLMASPLLSWWPQASQVWSDAQIAAIADAGARVMDRHGLTMGEAMSEWGPYQALAGATLPPAAATYAALRQHRAEMAEAAKRAGPPSRQP